MFTVEEIKELKEILRAYFAEGFESSVSELQQTLADKLGFTDDDKKEIKTISGLTVK